MMSTPAKEDVLARLPSRSTAADPDQTRRYHLMLISIHGLIRGDRLELGRDADTGGQTKYVVELTRALGEHPEVRQVDLVTRLIRDPRVNADYSRPTESLGPRARILRIPCGPDRYIPKEQLWPYLDNFLDNLVHTLRAEGRAPDLVHGHYADAGYVACGLASLLDLPCVFTGHSLGRIKRQRLLDAGYKESTIEKRYRMTRRIEAEETALEHASFIVTSTSQEVVSQYACYDRYQRNRMLIIPPGVDLQMFGPAPGPRFEPAIWPEIRKFLLDPRKPMILAICRPDPRKNLETLLHTYGEDQELQRMANLVVVAGTREDIRKMEDGASRVLQDLFYLVDYYDLYGKIALPKHHRPEDVPDLYRLAAQSHGVFINPALTEPFGLTLLEAAACGLPVVATHDGGPRDILGHCENGLLVDPQDTSAIAAALHDVLGNRESWRTRSRRGLRGIRKHYTWSAHVDKYMNAIRTTIYHSARQRRIYRGASRLITADRLVVTDIDNTLIGDRDGLRRLLTRLHEAAPRVAFGVATGRSLELTREVLDEWRIPTPQLLITSVGTAIHYGPNLVQDLGWRDHIHYRWRRDALLAAMADLPGIALQPPQGQTDLKISYEITDAQAAPDAHAITQHLRRSGLQTKVIYSHNAYIDLLPIRASKGTALRHFCMNWGIPLEHCLVAGDSGNDEEMLLGNTRAVVVGNYDKELEHLRETPGIYFAAGRYAWGILEGMEHYGFLKEGAIMPSGNAEGSQDHAA